MRYRVAGLCVLALLLSGTLLLPQTHAQSQLINGSRIITGSFNFCAEASDDDTNVNTYRCPLVPAIANYRTGTRYTFKPFTTNTGAASLNLNGLGVKTIKKLTGSITTDLVANDIRAGQIVDVIFDGTNMQMLSQSGNVPTTIASGAKALDQTQVGSATCGTVQTATATGTLTTDMVLASFNGDVSTVTGYTPVTTGTLRIDVYPTTNTINFVVCNGTANSITPGAVVTLNWRVVR